MRSWAPFLAAPIVVACSAASTPPPAAAACDPLSARPTTLGNIIGVGKDGAGTLYVADQSGSSPGRPGVRVFVSHAGSLVRQRVLGSGGGTSLEAETFQEPNGTNAPRDLVMQLVNGKATSMTLGPESSGKLRIEGFDAGAATALTLVGPNAAQGMPAIGLPGALSWVANATNGDAIVVTTDDLWGGAKHLFYGRPSAMVERPIVSFEQEFSGFASIGFTVGSETYVMTISSIPPADGGLLPEPGPVTLTTGAGKKTTFTLRTPSPTTLAGFTLTCLGS